MIPVTSFAHIVDAVYALPVAEQVELKLLLEHNITDMRRDAFLENYKRSQQELQAGQLHYSADINELKKML
jgi:hypothetical protein